jgi:hypothetical protein
MGASRYRLKGSEQGMTTPAPTEPDSDLARVGVTGKSMLADMGTVLPEGLAAWPTGWVDLGWISDDGLVESRSEDSTDFTPWQSNSPIRTEITKGTITFKMTLWESNFQTISLYYRKTADDMTSVGTGATAAIQFDEGGKPKQDKRSFGFDVIDGAFQRRLISPTGEVSDRGDITYKSDTMIGYELTVTSYDGLDPNGESYSVRRMFNEGWELPA